MTIYGCCIHCEHDGGELHEEPCEDGACEGAQPIGGAR